MPPGGAGRGMVSYGACSLRLWQRALTPRFYINSNAALFRASQTGFMPPGGAGRGMVSCGSCSLRLWQRALTPRFYINSNAALFRASQTGFMPPGGADCVSQIRMSARPDCFCQGIDPKSSGKQLQSASPASFSFSLLPSACDRQKQKGSKNRQGKKLISKRKMAPRAGFEPATNRLTAGCSTAELPGNNADQTAFPAYSKQNPALPRGNL